MIDQLINEVSCPCGSNLFYKKCCRLSDNPFFKSQGVEIATALMEKADRAFLIENYKVSYEYCLSAINYYQHYPYAYYLIGENCIKTNQYDSAIQAYYKALEYNNKNKQVLYKLAFCLAKESHLPNAINCLNRIIEQDNNFILALQLLGKIYYDSGENEKSKEIFEKLVVLDPSDGSSSFYLSKIKAKCGV